MREAEFIVFVSRHAARRWQGTSLALSGGNLHMLTPVTPRAVALIGLFAALNGGDLVSTWLDLHEGLREGNPFMSLLLVQHGFGALIVYKVMVVALVAIITIVLWSVRPRLVQVTLGICNFLVLGAVALNILQFPPIASIF
jgi:hypothetical protein